MTHDDNIFIDGLLRQHAYKTGEFTLKSGAKSNEYLDVRSALLHPIVGYACAAALLNELSEIGPVRAIAGVALGAVPLAATMSALCWELGYEVPALVVREVDKEHGMGGRVFGSFLPRRVMLVEDVVTTGASTLSAAAALFAAGHKIEAIGAVVVRDVTALQHVADTLSVPVVSLTTLDRIRACVAKPYEPEAATQGICPLALSLRRR